LGGNFITWVRLSQFSYQSIAGPKPVNALYSIKEINMDIIDNWPRWIRIGLLSVIAAWILAVVGNIFEFIPIGRVFKLGALAPTMLVMNLNISLYTLYAVIAIWWFLIGAILGTFVPKIDIAGVIWLAVMFSGAWLYYLLL
jgi:hypothetical protein